MNKSANQWYLRSNNLSANDSGQFVSIDGFEIVGEKFELENPLCVVVLTLQRVLHGRELVLVVAVPHAEERADGNLEERFEVL